MLLFPPLDSPRLLSGVAPNIRVHASPHSHNPTQCHSAISRPLGLANRCNLDGQEQADMGPLNRLRRLRSRYKLRRSAYYGEEDVAKDILQTHDATGKPEGTHHGCAYGEARW